MWIGPGYPPVWVVWEWGVESMSEPYGEIKPALPQSMVPVGAQSLYGFLCSGCPGNLRPPYLCWDHGAKSGSKAGAPARFAGKKCG